MERDERIVRACLVTYLLSIAPDLCDAAHLRNISTLVVAFIT